MRESHKHSPFHRIEAWSGLYFRPASLWEVGTYLLMQHHDGDGLCDTLRFQETFLDSQQRKKDEDEQTQLQNLTSQSEPGPGPPSPNWGTTAAEPEDVDMNDDSLGDAAFEASLNNLLQDSTLDDINEDDFDTNAAENDIQNVVEYLGPSKDSGDSGVGVDGDNSSGPDTDSRSGPVAEERPEADGLNNAYVRVLHTNGIHHIAMVTCSCQGQDKIALDLFASRLLPASFV